eukprot:SAG31_NODE_110_length_24476_cov_9.909654_12_plen_68_part_00
MYWFHWCVLSGALQLHGAMTTNLVGTRSVIALAEDGSSWMVTYSHYYNAMWSGLVRTKLSETVIVRL